MNIVVIGAGSTGLVYGSKLSEVTETQILCRRQTQTDAINTKGVTLKRPHGDEHFQPKATCDPEVLGSADLVISLTKCFDARDVAEIIKNNRKNDSALLALHNGLGTLEIYNQEIGMENVVGGVTYLGANRLDDKTAILGVGVRTVIGEQNGEESSRLREISDLFNQAGFKSEINNSVAQLIWDKLVLAVGQHAICAITGLSFKEIRESEDALRISKKLLDEAQAVGEKENIVFKEDLLERVKENLSFGADHYSSMFQDIKAGRKTEIDFINGAISRLGKKHGVETHVNDTISNLVKSMESK